jgi:sulfate/thiosulfate transport system substrate-binding protein
MKVWPSVLNPHQLRQISIRQMFSRVQFMSARWGQWMLLGLVGVLLSWGLTACGTGTANKSTEITLVSFSVTKAAHEAIIPKFVAKWQQETGQTVTFNQSYGGSGAQTRAVIDGLEADVVHLALALDTQKIETARMIDPGWEAEFPHRSIVTRSVAALITREGNPKGIKTWTDLARNDVKLITADPKTSGVARWNFLTLWNASLKTLGDETNALEQVTQIYKNVPALTRDAREATDVFIKQGQGDALINYENEIVLALQKGQKAEFVIPDVNVSIDNPIAIVDENVNNHGNRPVVEAFVKYLFTAEAQAEFAKYGFRPVEDSVAKSPATLEKYPPVKQLSTVQDYGGWPAVQRKFFADGTVFDNILAAMSR